ncbi:MAG: DNA primase [Pseudomonadota bacterium]
MALPPGFLEDLRDRVSLSQIVGRKVTWDMRKSNQSKGDWWAPCPFHQEKTASFHVDERKGYYYCFGCHVKGDAITFLRELDGMSFMEAVEEMAKIGGVEMPAPDPKAAAKAKTRAKLTDVMDHAVRHFRRNLASAVGSEARGYLNSRGLSKETIEAFEIGYAPPGWEGLREALTSGGVELDQVLACGLVRPSDKGRAPYDTFRNRIMFPIRDARGRAIAFGGRAMDPKDNAKYLNSPDTELFDKGRTLYNHGPARAACGKGAPLIVAEGYMDVIALAQAGFAGAVAPLGTAVTEDQLRMLWQVHPEPIVALDGDAAGLRAGYRLMDLALPLLEAGQSLRFALLPDGKDPDDVIRAGGPAAMQALLEGAVPMVELMWRRATEGRVLDSPERRAAFEKDLRQVLARIKDPSIKSHYGHALREKRADLFGLGAAAGQGPGAGFGNSRSKPRFIRPGVSLSAVPAPETRAVARATVDTPTDHLREAVILATLIAQPALIEEYADLLEETPFTGPGHARIASALLRCDVLATSDALWSALEADLGRAPLESLMAPRHVQLSPGLRLSGDVDAARACLVGEFAKLEAGRGAAREIAEAIEDLSRADMGGRAEIEASLPSGDGGDYGAPSPGPAERGLADAPVPYVPGPQDAAAGSAPWDEDGDRSATEPDPLTWRLAEAARAKTDAGRVQDQARTEYDVAQNGARIDRAERDAFSALLRSIGHADEESAAESRTKGAADPSALSPKRRPDRGR